MRLMLHCSLLSVYDDSSLKEYSFSFVFEFLRSCVFLIFFCKCISPDCTLLDQASSRRVFDYYSGRPFNRDPKYTATLDILDVQ